MTDTSLIGISQITNNTTSTRGGASKILQAGSWQNVTKDVCTTWQEDDNCDSWRQDVNRTAWPEDVNGNPINCFYNIATLVDYTAYLFGMAEELIHPNFWLPSHARKQLSYGASPDGGSRTRKRLSESPVEKWYGKTSLLVPPAVRKRGTAQTPQQHHRVGHSALTLDPAPCSAPCSR